MRGCWLWQGDPRVAQFYEKELVDKKLWPMGEDLRRRYQQTKELLLKIQGHRDLLQTPDSTLLQQKLALRGPYVTPLNVLQVHICIGAAFCDSQRLLACVSRGSPGSLDRATTAEEKAH